VFETSAEFTLFDYFRIPHTHGSDPRSEGVPLNAVWSVGDEVRRIFWAPSTASAPSGGRSGAYRLGALCLFGTLAADADCTRWLDRVGGTWRPAQAICDSRGRSVASVWRDEDGSVFLPFDPNEVIHNYWSERYREFSERALFARLRSLARESYYRVRPILPHKARLRMRRSFSRYQARTRFPGWPVETALHDVYRFLLDLLTQIAPAPIPMIAPWPGGSSWALVLTHDVEGALGYRNLRRLLEIEIACGYRSSWNFVPRNGYDVDTSLVEELHARGFEIGVHGLYHDGRDVDPATFPERLPQMRAYAERWDARGFRSPATLRSWELIPRLGFEFDSSYSDTAPFEPQPGGCCTWLPYMIENVVELPITLPQDHTLFEVLQQSDERAWLDKTNFLREQGGMALILTHPDYIGNSSLLNAYTRFLEAFADDNTAWKAVPGQVSSWWRRRRASELQHVAGNWCVVGPASKDAVVELVT
jgi:peptidoglycan/xylan/chitin deacetylase (PgdA/CDA1 family)